MAKEIYNEGAKSKNYFLSGLIDNHYEMQENLAKIFPSQ
jgi:hypothetical protein